MTTQKELDAAVDEAREAIRATLHKLAWRLGQDAYKYDMRGPMDSVSDMLKDFDPVCSARDEIEAEANSARAKAERRDLYRNTNEWGLR